MEQTPALGHICLPLVAVKAETMRLALVPPVARVAAVVVERLALALAQAEPRLVTTSQDLLAAMA